jgi:hypothetical protein
VIVSLLKKAGLFDQYCEEARGESILLSIRMSTLEEREAAKKILAEAGISELIYSEENAA